MRASGVTLIALSFLASPLLADEAAVRQAVDDYLAAFNKPDMRKLAAAWAEEAVHVDHATGERTRGRASIMADIKAALQEKPDTKLAGVVNEVTLITPAVASVVGRTTVLTGDETLTTQFSAVFVKSGASWRIASISEAPLTGTPQPYENLKALEWLVGRWVDRSDEVRVDTTFRWSPSKAYLLRSYILQTADGAKRQGTQIIGFDPRSRQIRSWTFNSDGSFGNAVWSQSGEEWLIKTSQTLADGRAASGTFVLAPQGEDKLSLRLIGHEIEGQPQPAMPAITADRVPEESDSGSPSTDSADPTLPSDR